MTPVVERIWTGTGWSTGAEDEPFLLGVTMPQSTLIASSALPSYIKSLCGTKDTAGLIPGVELEVFTDYASVSGGKKTIVGSTSISSPRIIENKIIYGPVSRASTAAGANIKFINCFFTMDEPWEQVNSGDGPAYTGLADARSNTTGRWTFERCHFDPTEDFAHPGISAIMGHHLTAYRCTWQRVVDGVSVYRLNSDPSTVLSVEVLGCINIYNSFFWAESQKIVHPTDYYTHNDAIQVQGGGIGDGYSYALDARGNLFLGYNFLADGMTVPPAGIPNGHDQSRHLAHQGVLLQQNQLKSVPITSRVSHNWVAGFAQPFTFKSSGTGTNGMTHNGTDYAVEFEGNILIADDHRLNGSSGGTDFYGVPGGHTYNVRIQPSIYLNGKGISDYPNDGVARAIQEGNNRYANTENIHANRRGQLMHVRRDVYWV